MYWNSRNKKMKSMVIYSLACFLLFFTFNAQAQTADECFQEAARLYLDGNLEDASAKLMETLKLDSDHQKAKSLLEIVLKEKGWIKGDVTEPDEEKPDLIDSMDFKEADIGNVLRLLAEESGSNIVAGDNIQGKVTVSFKDITLEDALDSILKVNGYDYIKEGKIIRIVGGGEVSGETASRIFKIQYAELNTVSEQVRQLLTPNGKILIDAQSNSIMIKDSPQVVAKIAEYIDEVDTMRNQVMIEAKLIETVLSSSERLGINWNMQLSATGAKRPITVPFKTWGSQKDYYPEREKTITITDDIVTEIESEFPYKGLGLPVDQFGLGQMPIAGADAFTFGTLDFSQFSMVLEALFNRGDTEILSSPRIATIDNKPASIHVGDTVPIPMYERNAETGNMEVTGYEEIQVGIRLTVTPHINQDGFILMEIVPTVSSITGFTGPNNERPITSQRTAQTTVMIKNGETVMIGGLIKENNVKTEKKVPILGDLPVIKYLFKHKVDTKQRTELLVFITPNLMKSGRIGGAAAAGTETN